MQDRSRDNGTFQTWIVLQLIQAGQRAFAVKENSSWIVRSGDPTHWLDPEETKHISEPHMTRAMHHSAFVTLSLLLSAGATSRSLFTLLVKKSVILVYNFSLTFKKYIKHLWWSGYHTCLPFQHLVVSKWLGFEYVLPLWNAHVHALTIFQFPEDAKHCSHPLREVSFFFLLFHFTCWLNTTTERSRRTTISIKYHFCHGYVRHQVRSNSIVKSIVFVYLFAP